MLKDVDLFSYTPLTVLNPSQIYHSTFWSNLELNMITECFLWLYHQNKPTKNPSNFTFSITWIEQRALSSNIKLVPGKCKCKVKKWYWNTWIIAADLDKVKTASLKGTDLCFWKKSACNMCFSLLHSSEQQVSSRFCPFWPSAPLSPTESCLSTPG